MSEYKEPIRISATDPICSATALEGTIIGILFDKTGEDIQTAIDRRTSSIDRKITDLQESIKDADSFVESKGKELEKLDDLYDDRADEKKAKLDPLYRKSRDISKEIQDAEYSFNKETEKIIAGKTVTFEEGFDKIEDKLTKVDDLIEKEKKTRGAGGGSGRLMGRSYPVPGVYCNTIDSDSISTNSGTSIYTVTSNANTGIGVNDPSASLDITQQEDRALARLNTLKQKIREYTGKIERIRDWIKELQEEKRRLILIRNNLDPKRSYKLDLNKLSAFGFEDVEVVQA
jgi:uncharacterized protein YoxC